MSEFLGSIWWLLVALGLLITFHEFGHYFGMSEEEIEEIEEKAEAPVERRQTADNGPSLSIVHRPLSLGERVTVSTLNAEGVITALGESDAEVQIGTIRVRARLSDLERIGKSKGEGEKSKVESRKSSDLRPVTFETKRSPGMEVDLRGLMSEDALDKMERYLEQAFLTGLPFVRIIHGKGIGNLKRTVHSILSKHPEVVSFTLDHPQYGGWGATIVHLREPPASP